MSAFDSNTLRDCSAPPVVVQPSGDGGEAGGALLIGTDCEGDRREFWLASREAALAFAHECEDNSDGCGWIAWEIRSDNPANGKEWACVASWTRRTEARTKLGRAMDRVWKRWHLVPFSNKRMTLALRILRLRQTEAREPGISNH